MPVYFDNSRNDSAFLTELDIENIRKIRNNRVRRYLEEQLKINKKVEDWAEFSLKPQTEEDIRNRLIIDKLTGNNSCCISYICTYSKLSEEFIEELGELTSVKTYKYNGDLKSSYNKLDWTAISRRQILSEEFIERHQNDVDWKMIYQFQNISSEFRKKFKHKLAIADRPEDL